MRSKRKQLVSLCACVLTVVVIAGLSMYADAQLEPAVSTAATTGKMPAAVNAIVGETPLYIVRMVDDEVRLITQEGYTVLQSIDVYGLRKTDAEALRRGIDINTEEELNAFLEDFAS